MFYEQKIQDYLKKSGGIITNSDCINENIPTVYLSRMTKKGLLFRYCCGVYITDDCDYDEFYFYQYRFKKAIYSYETALYLLGESDALDPRIEVSVNEGYKFNNNQKNIIVHYVKNEWYNLGIVETKTMYGNIVKVYCYERVICDFIKNRKNIDSETYVKAICSYKKYNKRDLDALYEIAEKMKILNKVIELMELVYE